MCFTCGPRKPQGWTLLVQYVLYLIRIYLGVLDFVCHSALSLPTELLSSVSSLLWQAQPLFTGFHPVTSDPYD